MKKSVFIRNLRELSSMFFVHARDYHEGMNKETDEAVNALMAKLGMVVDGKRFKDGGPISEAIRMIGDDSKSPLTVGKLISLEAAWEFYCEHQKA